MNQLIKRWRMMKWSERGFWLAGAAASIIITVVLVVVALSLDPAPPRRISLLTGSEAGAYSAAGHQIEAFLEAEGVQVDLITSEGSGENFARLMEGEADAALIQGGVGDATTGSDQLVSLGAVFYEPLWVFTAAGTPVGDIRDLAGLRIAAGSANSGTRTLLGDLLAANGISDVDWVNESGAAAAAALRLGSADAAVFITSPDRPYVRDLLLDPSIHVLDIQRSAAYSRLFPYLSRVTLHEGVIDLEENRPSADVSLIAPAAVLVVQDDLHPAIQSLLLQAMHEHFGGGSVLAPPASFPDRHLVSFPLSSHAARYYDRGGPAFLQRYLPFWAANLVDRIWILAIPVFTLVFPLLKSAPPLYSWQLRRRIKRFYRDLRALEQAAFLGSPPEQLDNYRQRLGEIRIAVRSLKVPWTYFDEIYVLQTHIAYVEHLLNEEEMKGTR